MRTHSVKWLPSARARSSPGSPARTAPIWPSCSSPRATRSTGLVRDRGDRDAPRSRPPCATGVPLVDGRPARPGGAAARARRRSARTSSTTSPRRRSCPPRGRTRPRRSRRSPAATATLLAAALACEPGPRVWVATSSEIFGDAGESPQHERSPMRPRTPYGVAKLAAHGLVGTLREHHGALRRARGSPTTTSPRAARRTSCRARSRAARRRSRSGSRTSSSSATSTRCATGRTPPTSCARPRLALRRRRAGRLRLRLGPGPHRRASSSTSRSPPPASTRGAACASTRRSCARPRPRRRSATRARAARSSAGSPRGRFEAMIGEMVDADLAELRA